MYFMLAYFFISELLYEFISVALWCEIQLSHTDLRCSFKFLVNIHIKLLHHLDILFSLLIMFAV